MRQFYELDGLYVYAVQGLRLEGDYEVSPCSGTSRWLKNNTGTCVETSSLDATTKATLVSALASSSDTNAYVRDIKIGDDDSTCDSTDASTIGAWLEVTDAASGETNCWQHVQGDTLNVYDFSYWGLRYIHPGNDIALSANKANPITAFAEAGGTRLHFPSWHSMSDNWDEGTDDLTLLGRLGDTINFKDLSSNVQTTNMASLVGALGTRLNDGFEACGSPGEVANDPTLGWKYT